MKAIFNKISIDFEYLNEIYTIKSDPYKTLSELKEIISRKMFPYPAGAHCFYKNMDLFDQEDDEISKIFPNKVKIKITLKKPQKEKSLKKSSQKRNSQVKVVSFDTIPISPISPRKDRTLNSKTIRKKNITNEIILPKIENIRMKGRQSCVLYNIKKIENNLNEEKENNNSENDSNEKDDITSYKKLIQLEDSEKEAKSLLDKYKGKKIDYLLTDKKEINDMNFLLSSLKSKNNNKYKLGNSFNISKSKLTNNKEKDKDNYFVKTELNNDNKFKLVKRDLESDDKDKKIDNENIAQENFDENYSCNSCKKNIISQYCINCNTFKCNSCIDLCKTYSHEILQINLNEDCFKIIMSYYDVINSNINNSIEEIWQYKEDLKIIDIKKSRDEIVSLINDVLNIYNEVINILENNIYKDKTVKKEMNKYEIESNKIKSEINDIIQKLNSYIKNEENISKPKYKMMNMQYFYNLLNEKGKSFNILTQNMKVFTLNHEINSNIEKSFNDMENIMKSMANLENPFSLSKELNIEYHKLIEIFNNSKRERKKMFMKRKTISLKGVQFSSFPRIGSDNASEANDDTRFNL